MLAEATISRLGSPTAKGDVKMGIFSIFRPTTSDEIYQRICQKIVIFSLKYATEKRAPDIKRGASVACEMAYLFLHLVDRSAFNILCSATLDIVIDKIAFLVVTDLVGAASDEGTSQDDRVAMANEMLATLNSRSKIYSQCQSILGDGFPSRGSMAFAASFFIHRALGLTDQIDFDEILTGKRDICGDEIEEFPDLRTIYHTAIYIGLELKEMQFEKDLEKLNG